jgi:pyruvate-formate lyase
MSEQDDTAEIIKDLCRLAPTLRWPFSAEVTAAANRLQQLHDRLAAIEQANTKQSAINEAYYQQVIKETRDYGND